MSTSAASPPDHEGFVGVRAGARGRGHVQFSGADARAALDEIVTALGSIDAARRRLEAREAGLLERAQGLAESEAIRMPDTSERELAYRVVHAELGAAATISDRSMARRVEQAVTLVRDYPGVHAALGEARVDRARAMATCDAGEIIGDPSRRSAYEIDALAYAEQASVNRVRPQVARLAELHADRSLDQRHAEALEERVVTLTPMRDGMALVQAVLSAGDARRVHARLTRHARELAVREHVAREEGGTAPVEGRTLDQQRADALVDLILRPGDSVGASGSAIGAAGESPLPSEPVVQARVQVIVPVTALMRDGTGIHDPGLDDPGSHDPIRPAAGAGTDLEKFFGGAGPAMLAGYGPIGTDDAHRFAASAEHWDMVRTHPVSGEVLAVDRYRPSAAMRRRLAARDWHCRFPGCRQPVARCDLDHTIDAQYGGSTATNNLAHLCRWHHTLKHHSPWQVEQDEGGVMVWTSPTGRTYRDRPVSRVMFAPVAPHAPPDIDAPDADAGDRAEPPAQF